MFDIIRVVLLTVAVVAFSGFAPAAEPLQFVKKPELTFDATTQKWSATFALNAPSDVEVAIIDPASNTVIRHLVAGVLGTNAPAPLAGNSLMQRIAWDGRDDYRQPVDRLASMVVRVRAGMTVTLEQIAGGDPYLYFLDRHGDHNPWGINGLELKSDGKVYVLGHSSTLGPPALRQYDRDGNYLRTVFPPPAGKDIEAMKGWGINVRADGTYTPKFNRLTDPSMGTTILDTGTGGMARLFPTPDPDRLSLWMTGFDVELHSTFEMMTLNTDGTIPPLSGQMQGLLVKSPPIKADRASPLGPVFTGLAPDGRHFYLSGIYGCSSVGVPMTNGFWRDGQVWKADFATRTATPFFALDGQAVAAAAKDRKASIGGVNSYAMLHGVAVDKDENVFVCDRLNKRVVVLDTNAKIIRAIPVESPDAVAVSSRTGALYVTTRFGCERSGEGAVGLLKFNDWRKDSQPSVSLPQLAHTWYTSEHKHSYVLVCEKKSSSIVWVAYTELPVRIYEDDGKSFTLLKDFYALGVAQGCHGFDRLEVDRKTEDVYLADDHSSFWKVSDWPQPKFSRMPFGAASIAIDSRNRFLYINPGGSVWSKAGISRLHLDQKNYPPANFGEAGRNVLTPRIYTEWCFTGNSDMGFAVAPNGNLVALDQRGHLFFFHGTAKQVPWEGTVLANVNPPSVAGGVQFDLAGNLYVGCRDGKRSNLPPVFRDDSFASQTDRWRGCAKIVKYAPTGTMESGNLFPVPPTAPTKVYEVNYGAFDTDCIVHTPRFNVDEFGRIYYPMNIEPRVSVLDNAGNEILHFGTYGNRDSMGGLPGDLVPTRGIPLGFPNSVAATDNYIYVADMVNHRVLRLKKKFAVEAMSR